MKHYYINGFNSVCAMVSTGVKNAPWNEGNFVVKSVVHELIDSKEMNPVYIQKDRRAYYDQLAKIDCHDSILVKKLIELGQLDWLIKNDIIDVKERI